MIEVDIALVPFGNEELRRSIGKVVIANTCDHMESPEYGNYVCHGFGEKPLVIRDFRRNRGAIALVMECFNKACEKQATNC